MISFFDFFYRGVYTRIFPDYLIELKKAIGDCKSILDVGCGKSSLLKYFSKSIYSEGVEAFEPYIEESRRQRIHNKYHKMDVLHIQEHFQGNSFECAYAGDIIEHLEKDHGFRLISMMEYIASKKVIIFTPNGFLPLGPRDGNDLYIHRSGWTTTEMQERRYKVIGLNGWKVLRGNDVGIRLHPRFFWRVISDITQFYTRNHPEHAKQLLCVKEL